ncbi:general substrate transporter [Auriscalpium vulgare]|uniref:General substrate transporter n=1 Tax=Auriscalpium vulgare TaxID=40419 RepID=A0ACB8RKG8_9AGAM|nr:general substrate transporter [Auriscalpium vulgare]
MSASESPMEKEHVQEKSPIEEKGSPDGPLADVSYLENKTVRMTPKEKQEALAQALAVDPGVKPTSWAAFHLYLIVLCACCCSGDSGFDGTVMGGVNSMKQYQHYFGLKAAGAKTGIVFGIYTIGSLTGAIPASYLPDRFGRRVSMFTGNAILIVGAVITGTATNKSTFIGGRFLTGVGSATAGASAKSYLAELTPPQTRGLYLGLLNSFYYVGQMTATGMMVSTGKYTDNLSWRLPLFVQIVPAILNVLFIFFCPESPRWLYSIGKPEKAREILAKLHSQTGDINSPLVNLEMYEIQETLVIGGGDKHWWDFRPLFRTAGDRYRSYMIILIGTFGQLSGNGLITYFLPVLLSNAGITSQNRKLTLNFVNSVTSFIGALSGAASVDHIGRRKLLLISTGSLVVVLAIVTGLLSKVSDSSGSRSTAGISFIYLFMVVYSFGWTPMQALYGAEVLSYEARAKGLAFLNLVNQASSCINTFALPVALEKITWKVYIIFLVWDAFEFLVIYFTLVETKGLTLEEIEEVFAQPNPKQYSLDHRKELLDRNNV